MALTGRQPSCVAQSSTGGKSSPSTRTPAIAWSGPGSGSTGIVQLLPSVSNCWVSPAMSSASLSALKKEPPPAHHIPAIPLSAKPLMVIQR